MTDPGYIDSIYPGVECFSRTRIASWHTARPSKTHPRTQSPEGRRMSRRSTLPGSLNGTTGSGSRRARIVYELTDDGLAFFKETATPEVPAFSLHDALSV